MAGRVNLLIAILTVILFRTGYGQGIEEQRKYLIQSEEVIPLLFDGQKSFGGVQLIQHGTDNYYDIYLDSPDLILKRSGYSLRFRRRHSDDTLVTYSLQLKSEMADLGGIRIEVEEQELDFYRVIVDSSWVSLPKILDPIFEYSESGKLTEEVVISLSYLQEWIKFKSGAPLLPFQQLKAIDPNLFNEQMIGSFRPVLTGISHRSRFHGVYKPSGGQPNIDANHLPPSKVPLIIQEDPTLNWVLEASYDKSMFRAISEPEKSVSFTEFEAENKYYLPDTGRMIMNSFEKAILNELHFSPSKDSKYIRATESLLNQ